jgi:hypothetical protein
MGRGRAVQQAYVVTGSVTDERTVKLDEALPIKEGKVRVVVEVMPPDVKSSYMDVMETIWARQRERGHVPPTREEVDAYLKAERESWDD